MDSDYSPEVGGGRDGDFGFAFNDSNFSDHVLRIEIINESTEARPDGEGCTSLADWGRNRKRRREDINGCFCKGVNVDDRSWLILEELFSFVQKLVDFGVRIWGLKNEWERSCLVLFKISCWRHFWSPFLCGWRDVI